jgi:hypothetical protein
MGLEHMTEKITKLEIARRQIDTAIELLFSKKDLCSIVTLAAAGEEILGRLLRRRGKQPALDRMISDTYAIVREILPGYKGELPNEKYLVEKANYARNHLKHLDRPDLFELELELFNSAFSMLVRSVENYEKVNGQISEQMERFNILTKRVQDNFTNSS